MIRYNILKIRIAKNQHAENHLEFKQMIIPTICPPKKENVYQTSICLKKCHCHF